MKKLLALAVLLTAGTLLAQDTAQQPTDAATATPSRFTTNLVAKPQAPTYSDVNCSGFVTKEAIPMTSYIIGGERSPHVAQFGARDQLFLTGESYQVGSRYRIVRRVKNPNRSIMDPTQPKLMAATGDQWADVGVLHVTDLINGTALALFDFSCMPAVPGDVVIAFTERPQLEFPHRDKFQEFGVPTGSTTGQIIMGKEFDYLFGRGNKVYLNIGSEKGLKAGDILRVTRGYDWDKDVAPVDKLSENATTIEDTNDRMPNAHDTRKGYTTKKTGFDKKMPRRGLGELMVLWSTPNSAVAMVTYAHEDIHVGDTVEVAPSAQQ